MATNTPIPRIRPWPALLLLCACTGSIDQPSGPLGADGDHVTDPEGPGGSDAPSRGPLAQSRFARLNHRQWENTVRDLLRLSAPSGLSSAFVAEPLRSTFDTNGGILTVSQDLSRDYQSAAEKLAEQVATDPELLARLAPPSDDQEARIRAFVRSFGLRAFRRPLGADEQARIVALFARGPELVARGDAFQDGVELVLTYFLQAPDFLYRVEHSDAAEGDRVPLDSYELATRLSYGLTNSMPDDALFERAARDELRTREGVIAAARGLLDGPGARATLADFHAQLLKLHDYATVSRDPGAYPAFGEGMGAALEREALTFVDEVVANQDQGLRALFTAPFTFVNERTAPLYGLEGITGDEFVRVELDTAQRAGLLTQAGFLATFGEGATPNTILRGVQLARRVLCVELPPPPQMVPALPPIEPGGTNRERVEKLTEAPACAGCHVQRINPLGVAFEHFDGLGRYRDEENGRAVDARSAYTIDGEQVAYDGAVELATRIADSAQAHDCYARHWLEYVAGREVDPKNDADAALVRQAGTLSRESDSVRALIVALVSSDLFMTRPVTN